MPLGPLILILLALVTPAEASWILLGNSATGGVSSCTPAPCYNGQPFIALYDDWTTDNNSTSDQQSCGTNCDLTLDTAGTDPDAAVNATCPAGWVSGGVCLDLTDATNEDDYASSAATELDPSLSTSGDRYTVCAPVYPNANDNNSIFFEQSNDSNAGFQMRYLKTGDKCEFRARLGGAFRTATGATDSCTNSSWYYLCGVIENNSGTYGAHLYIDGVLAASSATSTSYVGSTVDFGFGATSGGVTKASYVGEGAVVLDVYPSDDEMCIMANCGPWNEFSCTCSGTNFAASTGRALSCMSGIASGQCAAREIGTQ